MSGANSARAWVARCGGCIVLGLVTSVAVAWWIALEHKPVFTFVHSPSLNIAPPDKPSYHWFFDFKDAYRPNLTRVECGNNPGPTEKHTIDARLAAVIREKVNTIPDPATRGAGGGLYPYRAPQWPAWLRLPSPDASVLSASARAAGWPSLCLSQHSWVHADGTAESRGSLRVRDFKIYTRSYDPDAGTVPLLPVWPGLLANTAVFAGGWFAAVILPWAGWKAWRRSRRVRKGLCGGCGYALGGQPRCPECGIPA